MTEHPAGGSVQRLVLDRIGAGSPCRGLSKRMRDALLRNGLIVECGDGGFEMPIPVHMQWCAYWAERAEDETK